MSRAYRIAVSETVSRVIHVEDGVETSLEALPVLPPEDMARQTEAELERRGFRKSDNGVWLREEKDGVVIEVDPKTGKVTVSLTEEEQVSITREASATGDEDFESHSQVEARAAGKARQSAERELRDEEEKRKTAVTSRLEKQLGSLRAELDSISNSITKEALKAKAASMGEIEEVSEDGEDLTIKVKI